MFTKFEASPAATEPLRRTCATAPKTRALSVQMPVSPYSGISSIWGSFQADRVLALPYSFDRFADGALVTATIGAVVTLFVAALV